MQSDFILIKGAKQHNLKDVSLKIPKNKLVVFTGLSGSGKSSLAFDTIYAEGQRRYVESLSSYARQFLGVMSKPEVEAIDGLSPAIAIDQKSTSHNPRSTVGTITEIYDYLRLLFARIGHPHCPKCGREISTQTIPQIVDQILESILQATRQTQNVKFAILAPIVRDRKGAFKDLFKNLQQKGIRFVRVDNTVFGTDEDISLIKTNKHNIEAIIERLTFDSKRAKQDSEITQLKSRLYEAVEASLKLADGLCILSQVKDRSFTFPQKPKNFADTLYSERFACPIDNISLPEIEPRLFSFNSPHGACPTCNGLGSRLKVDPELIIAPEISISEGAIIPYASSMSHDTWFRCTVEAVLSETNHSLQTPYNQLPKSVQSTILYGSGDKVYTISGNNKRGKVTSINNTFEGFIPNLERRYSETDSEYIRAEIQKYMRQEDCHACDGKRLKPQALGITINGSNIHDITNFSISQALTWVKGLNSHISSKEKTIAAMITKELKSRLGFLVSVGLSYLTLSRQAGTLAGGEAQRIRLASQIGTGLTGVLYVLDEPTIGLHQRDNVKLIATLKNLRNLGNTVVVVEHDQETIESADWIIDFGPFAGKHGGEVIAQGTLTDIKKESQSLTGKYLSGKKKVNLSNFPSQLAPELPAHPTGRSSSNQSSLSISGCRQHNLKDIDVTFPLGMLISVTGVSGSGKSTLIHDTLYHALAHRLNRFHRQKPGKFDNISGTKHVSKVSLITQSPIGRTPRSNPITYTKAFDGIRQIFATTQEAKIRGYTAGRFSFNVKGGRCEACQGGGEVKIEMQFLPDVYVTCDVCQGKRYNEETLAVTYKNKNISEVLDLTVEDALKFFAHVPAIARKLTTLSQVGLDYIELGQPAPQLSGGEAQRVKLAKELSIRSLGHTIYLLDEPTTGLHFADLQKLLYVLKALVAQNNTVIVIEHNLDVIKNSDWVIDLGPEGGEQGGAVVTSGTPTQVAKHKTSHTAKFLRKIFK